MSARGVLIVTFVALHLWLSVEAFYLPGVAPHEYEDNESVDVKVNTLSSTKTQMPYEYYSLAFCEPNGGKKRSEENLGELLRGDRIYNSPYTFEMGVSKTCEVVCTRTMDEKQAKQFMKMVDEEYRVNMIVDNLPVAYRTYSARRPDDEQLKHVAEAGFPLGIVPRVPATWNMHPQKHMSEGNHYLYNHLRFILFYHEDETYEGKRIVGFEVEPISIKYTTPKAGEKPAECDKTKDTPTPLQLDNQKNVEVTFTYSVDWKPSGLRWASRWDVYLHMTDNQIHWFSIINSLMIVLFLTGMVAMILMRTLNQDFRRYNQLETAEDAQEETGWKLVHGDVFRPPTRNELLAVYVGTGVQVFGMTLVTMVCAALGLLSPANRGGLMLAMLLLFVFMGCLAGYYSARYYKMFNPKGTEWKRVTLRTALMFPGIVFSVFLFLNLLIAGQKSAGAVSFWVLVSIMLLWFGISVPLVFLGSYFGMKKAPVEFPVRTNQIPRQIPDQAWYMQPAFSILIGGILPFGAVFIELFFILSSLWLHQFYYMFTFLFIVFVILILTCAEITIVLCYFQLCSEDYHWWWRSYLTSGSSALYLFAYSVFYFFTKLDMDRFVSALMFFGYMFTISYGFFCLTGTIGFLACFLFVRKIYASVKVD